MNNHCKTIIFLLFCVLINAKDILNESINYILDGNYIYSNKYIEDKDEIYYYNNISTLSRDDNKKIIF